jgi:GNAT superfamily N-acetyltransferase
MPVLPAILIRRFSENDLPHLCNLISETIEKCYTGVYHPKAVSFFHEYHSPENVLRDAAAGITLVAWLNQKLVATATLTENYICRVFVHPSLQGIGIGKAIAEEIEGLAIENGINTLELDASLTSRSFWTRLGWQVTAPKVEMVDGVPLEYYKMMKVIVSSKCV